MNRILLLCLATLALTGCASGNWGNYAAEHNCAPTGQVQHRKVMTATVGMSSVPSGIDLDSGGSNVSYVQQPGMRQQAFHLFRCDNGEIWVKSSVLKRYALNQAVARQ